MGRRFRVLVADDNCDAATSLAMLLELSGYEVEVAFDGLAALKLAERWPPDAAILDIRMPGLNGYEVARALRARLPQHVVLLAYSAELMVRQRDLAAARVFDLCFSKGMEFLELRQQLDNLLKCRLKSSPGVPEPPSGGEEEASKGGATDSLGAR
jgi:CheY-like chemotaxis protein